CHRLASSRPGRDMPELASRGSAEKMGSVDRIGCGYRGFASTATATGPMLATACSSAFSLPYGISAYLAELRLEEAPGLPCWVSQANASPVSPVIVPPSSRHVASAFTWLAAASVCWTVEAEGVSA